MKKLRKLYEKSARRKSAFALVDIVASKSSEILSVSIERGGFQNVGKRVVIERKNGKLTIKGEGEK